MHDLTTPDREPPDRETMMLATTAATEVLGAQHSVTRTFAQAALTMERVDLWHARLATRSLRADQREAIVEVAKS